MVSYMVTDRDAQGMRVGHVKIYGPATDLQRTSLWIKRLHKGWSYDCFLIRKPFPCQSVADL